MDAELRRVRRRMDVMQLWTLARVAQAIQRVTGVRYRPGRVWRLLRELGWTGSARPGGLSSNATRRRSPVGSSRTGRA